LRNYKKSNNKTSAKILSDHEHYILTFKSFYSNFFIMLTDNLGNPLISCSTGQVSNSRSKKKKNSMMLIYPMMKRIKSVLIKRRIKYLAIHIRTDLNAKVYTAIKFLKYSRMKFKVTYIALLKPIPHHLGRRKKKPRRI
jgi:ribosomal protein S11